MTTSLNYPNLPNAPIEEAIISLTIGQQKHQSLEEVEGLCVELQEAYPPRKTWSLKEFAFEVSDTGMNSSHNDKANGFVLY